MSRGPREARQVRTVYRHSRAEAVEALAELKASHGPLNGRTLTVGAFLERWVRDARDIRPTTRHGYEAVIRTHLCPRLAPSDSLSYHPFTSRNAAVRNVGANGPKTARNAHVVLGVPSDKPSGQGLVNRNVASREYIDPPKVTVEEPDALTDAELARIRAVLPGHPLECHVAVALGTGLRQGEQLGLAWEDLDLDAGRLNVRRELAYEDGQYVRVDPKTPRSRRTVPLAPPIVALLRKHREQLVARGFVTTSTGPVFVSTTGTPLSGSWLTHRWYGLLEDARSIAARGRSCARRSARSSSRPECRTGRSRTYSATRGLPRLSVTTSPRPAQTLRTSSRGWLDEQSSREGQGPRRSRGVVPYQRERQPELRMARITGRHSRAGA
jgi:integrase